METAMATSAAYIPPLKQDINKDRDKHNNNLYK